MSANNPLKRSGQHANTTHRQPKRRKVHQAHQARNIATQTTSKAYANGEIDVEKFVRSREYEINALEDAVTRAKGALTTRAFQNVPRELRRRTASHNVKRVPQRLRARAKKEMVEDNTPAVTAQSHKRSARMRRRVETFRALKILKDKPVGKEKQVKHPETLGSSITTPNDAKVPDYLRAPGQKKNALQRPPRPKAKFRKRQIHKAWLPTHLFHAKRARMTPPKEPLWRMAIPLSPTQKSYRVTHRASVLRGAVAWDMSYISTIGLRGPRTSLMSLFKAIGVGKDEDIPFWKNAALSWVCGNRSWTGWLYHRNAWPSESMAPATVVWQKPRYTHPNTAGKHSRCSLEDKASATVFIRTHPSAFLEVWQELMLVAKVQKPVVSLEDLRFEIGSIELTGPNSAEAICRILRRTSVASDIATEQQDQHSQLWSMLTTVSSPAALPKNVVIGLDVADPRLHQHKARAKDRQNEDDDNTKVLHYIANWPVDMAMADIKLFDRSARLLAARQMPSQKAINRRRQLAGLGNDPTSLPNDPKIPVLLLANNGNGRPQASWTLLLPWRCVLPVWYSLMYVPLSSGGNVRFAGLDQIRQLTFEAGVGWFPGDYPGTQAGRVWAQKEAEHREAEWLKSPKGKRIEYESIKLNSNEKKGEVGHGWACEWERLLPAGLQGAGESRPTQRRIPFVVARDDLRGLAQARNYEHRMAGLVNVRITLLARGVVQARARIYRLPATNSELCGEWLAYITHPPDARGSAVVGNAKPITTKESLKQERDDHKHKTCPEIPSQDDLIGFVTTGCFNLGEGRGTAVGCISLAKSLEAYNEQVQIEAYRTTGARQAKRLCIVRDAGHSVGRLAKWELTR